MTYVQRINQIYYLLLVISEHRSVFENTKHIRGNKGELDLDITLHSNTKLFLACRESHLGMWEEGSMAAFFPLDL